VRVLVLATTFPRWEGDTEPAFVHDLCKGLVGRGHEIIALVPHAPGAKLLETMNGIRVRRFRYFIPARLQRLCYDGGALPNLRRSWLPRLQLPVFLAAQACALVTVLVRYRPTLVHCHWIVPQGFFAAVLKPLFRYRLILTAHAGDVFTMRNRLLKRFGKLALQGADAATVNSNATIEALLRVERPKQVRLVPMGVDLRHFGTGQTGAAVRERYRLSGPVVLGVGRFAEKKGFKYLIRALSFVRQRYPEAELLLVGFGPLESDLRAESAEAGLAEAVHFAGRVTHKDLPQYYAAADVFVLPSVVTTSGDTEGLGVVLLEAMAQGVPVVACEVGGIPDIVTDGETGLLARQRDPRDLADRILALLGDAALRDRLVVRGRARVRSSFSWDRITDRFDKLYTSLEPG
jgi:glycosyltransferase involved in cell wall biosynthesis